MVGQKEKCSEAEENTGKLHWQVFVQYKKQIRTTALFKDFPKGVWWNEVARSVPGSIKYCQKEDTRVEPPRTWGNVPTIQRKSTQLGLLVKDMMENHLSRKNAYLKYPEVAINKGRQIDHWLDVIHSEEVISSFKISDFESDEKHKPNQCAWEEITDWSVSHIIWGRPGGGKTQFALAHFKHPFFVRHIDDLKKFDQSFHDGIVFDDMDFLHYPRTAQIHLTDIDQPSSINVKHGTATIPANTKKIFCTNNDQGRIFDPDDGAIKRRIRIHYMIGSHNPKIGGFSDWLPHQQEFERQSR